MNIDEIQICSNSDPETFIIHARLLLEPGPDANNFLLKDFWGLDAAEIVRTYDDGPAFFRVKPSEREVALLVAINPNYSAGISAGDFRDTFYKLISYNTRATAWNSESKLQLRFLYKGDYVASLYGFINKFEASPYTADPEVKITITCDEPFLQTHNEFDLSGYVNNSPAPKSHVFNTVSYDVGSELVFDDIYSTAPHGFTAEIQIASNCSGILIWDDRNADIYLFVVVYAFLAGDIVNFSSELNNKYINLEDRAAPGDQSADLLPYIVPGSIWPMLLPGENLIEISEPAIWGTFGHKNTFWGV